MAQTLQEEKNKEKESPPISVSDVNKVIEELTKLQENRVPAPTAIPNRFPQAPQLPRAGARIAGQAGRLAVQAATRGIMLLFTTPVGWVILGVGAVAIITFAIVFSVGGGGIGFSSEQITPTPAVP